MADDLTQAAHTAVLGVRALRERLGEAREGCDESTGRVDALTEALESDRKALHEAVEELDKAVEEGVKLLADDVAAAESGLADVANASHESGAQGQQVLDAEAAAHDELAQHLRDIGPRIAGLAEAAEAASRAALERAAAIADELSQVVDEAEQLLTMELSAALAEMTHELENTATAIKGLLDHQCPEILLESETEFGAKMSEVEDLVNRVFPDLEKHTDEVAGYAVEKFVQLVDEEMDDIETQGRTLEGELENLTGLAADKTTEIEHAGESIVNAMQENGESAKTVEQALEDVRARWITFGFTA